jgi:multidrug efflux pump subunit AcrA (membrane-fusion protein)
VVELRALAGKAGVVKVHVWNDDTLPLAAVVREVAAAADPATRTFVVKADIGRANVRLGQTANVKIEMTRVAGQIKLPLAAVFEVKGAPAVWVVDRASMTVKQQPVRVAGAEGNDVVLAAGLAPGETVVIAGVHVLSPGQKVRLYAERAAGGANAAMADGNSVAVR